MAGERERPTITWTPDALEVQRLVVEGRLTPYDATTPNVEGGDRSLWDSRPDPREPGPPSGRFLRAFPTREALEAWIRRRAAAGGLP